jgi:hypothetical protein
MIRKEVYEIIDSERNYQDNLGPYKTDGRLHTVGDYLTMLSVYVDKAQNSYIFNSGDKEALEEIRKIAGICVLCMEKYGGFKREVKDV